MHCQYAPRAGCSALRPGTTFLRRSRARVRCASVSPPSRPRHRPPRADPARSAVFRPFNRGRLSSPVKLPVPGSGSFPRSAPHECVREWAPQRVERSVKISPSADHRGHLTAVPARTTTGSADATGRIRVFLRRSLFISPFEACPVRPDATQDDGNLARNCNLALLGADPLHQSNALGF